MHIMATCVVPEPSCRWLIWPAAPRTAVPPTPWAAVRACAVTLNKKSRVKYVEEGGSLAKRTMVRSARSIEECVQCGPRSEFVVKGPAHKNSGRQEEGDRFLSLGVTAILDLLQVTDEFGFGDEFVTDGFGHDSVTDGFGHDSVFGDDSVTYGFGHDSITACDRGGGKRTMGEHSRPMSAAH